MRPPKNENKYNNTNVNKLQVYMVTCIQTTHRGCVHNCTSGENVDLTIGYQRYYC